MRRRRHSWPVHALIAEDPHSHQEVRAILTDPKYDEVGTPKEKAGKLTRVENMGLYFVEYLRGVKAIPNAIPKMGSVFEQIGRGRTYEQAFAQTYGISVKQVIPEITALFERTQANPADRFKKTRFEEDLAKSRSGAS